MFAMIGGRGGSNMVIVPDGKYTISDTSIVGVECKYDKKDDSWEDCIVALRPGKATVTQWCDNEMVNRYKITVTRSTLDSISSFFDCVY